MPENVSQPTRIQRRRTKGWRMPENTIYVGRPTKWGNPWRPALAKRGSWDSESGYFATGIGVPVAGGIHWGPGGRERALADCVAFHELHVGPSGSYELDDEALAELRGKNLACWCPLDRPCHADTLLRMANG